MRIVIAGGSGFIGRSLIPALGKAGHEITQLVRREPTLPTQLRWDPARPVELPPGTDAVINLCGVGVGDRRWNVEYKKQIRNSRVVPSRTLAQAVTHQGIPVLINAAGVGFYGECGDRVVDESAPAGDDFLAHLAVEWEGAALSATDARVVVMRTGMPLDRRGGFLKPQLLPFQLGVGGKLGNGRHWVPWISFTDWLRAVQFVLTSEQIRGPVNMVGPDPATNAEFTRALAHALHRPAIFRIPKLAIHVLYGEFANEAFRSLRVVPRVLLDNGFTYQHPTLPEALDAALK